MGSKGVVVHTGLSLPKGVKEVAEKFFANDFKIVAIDVALKEENQNMLREIVGILNFGHFKINSEFCKNFPNLKVVSNIGAGVDHIDVKALNEMKICVGHTPGVLSSTTADLGFALLMASARKIVEADRFCSGDKDTADTRDIHGFLGTDFFGKVAGIVGMGSIGKELAKRCRAFGMQVVYHNRKPCTADEEKAIGASYCKTLPDLLAASDFVFLIVPLTEQTRGMISTKELSTMKSTAHLINIARGGVVDTVALTKALREKKIAAAALDVTDPEPLGANHPLRSMSNVILTPHIGSATLECRLRMGWMGLDNLINGIKGEKLVRTPGVNPSMFDQQRIFETYCQKVSKDGVPLALGS
mmetsp:Transcript_26063/g.62781  ORF Transcript_26063/g.62781 Transcript_26063/m.62781 type:complete len:358 (-) Transcript_26063:235-1308(-)